MSIYVAKPTGTEPIPVNYEPGDQVSFNADTEEGAEPSDYWHVFDLFRSTEDWLLLQIQLMHNGEMIHNFAQRCPSMEDVTFSLNRYAIATDWKEKVPAALHAQLAHRYDMRKTAFLDRAIEHFGGPKR